MQCVFVQCAFMQQPIQEQRCPASLPTKLWFILGMGLEQLMQQALLGATHGVWEQIHCSLVIILNSVANSSHEDVTLGLLLSC